MTWNSNVFNSVIIVGSSGELLVYSPTIGAGNLIYSISSRKTTDAFGNVVLQGATSYLAGDTSSGVQVNQNALIVHSDIPTPGGDSTAALEYVGTDNMFLLSLVSAANSIGLLVGGTPLFANSFAIVPPSGDTTGVLDAANIAAALALTDSVVLLSGTYTVAAGSVTLGASQWIRGQGLFSTVVNGKGSGDVFRAVDTTATYLPGGGGITGLTISLTGMTGTGSGVHAGDLYNWTADFGVENMPSGYIGAWFDNQYLFMEQLRGRVWFHGSTDGCTGVQFDNSTGTTVSAAATGSFDRAQLDIMCDMKGKGNLVVFANGAFMQGQRLGIYGNTDYGAHKYYVLTLTGSNAGGSSRIGAVGAGSGGGGELNIDVECNAMVGTQPGTINFASGTHNTIVDAIGNINFNGANPFAAANNAFKSFFFNGPVYGDTQLTRFYDLGLLAYDNGAIVTAGTIQADSSTSKISPAGNVTGIILADGTAENQILTVFNDGTGSATFDVTATSHVAGGTAVSIPAKTSMTFYWKAADFTWYQETPSAAGHLSGIGAAPAVAAGAQASAASIAANSSDLGGTITITANVGAVAGQLATVTFAVPFINTPTIAVVGVNLNAATAICYATSGSNTGFQINSVNNPASGGAHVVNYIVTGQQG